MVIIVVGGIGPLGDKEGRDMGDRASCWSMSGKGILANLGFLGGEGATLLDRLNIV